MLPARWRDTIVVGYDGKDGSERVLDAAIAAVRDSGGTLVVAVAEYMPVDPGMPSMVYDVSRRRGSPARPGPAGSASATGDHRPREAAHRGRRPDRRVRVGSRRSRQADRRHRRGAGRRQDRDRRDEPRPLRPYVRRRHRGRGEARGRLRGRRRRLTSALVPAPAEPYLTFDVRGFDERPQPLRAAPQQPLPAALPRDRSPPGIGNWLAVIALAVDVYDRTHSGWWVGELLIANILPAVFIGLLLGPLVDRLSRKGLMIASDLGRLARVRGAAVRGLAPARSSCSPSWRASATRSSVRPCSPGLPNLVPASELSAANALLQLVDWTTTALGPLARRRCSSAASGPHLAYVVNAVTFAFSAAPRRRSSRRACSRASARSAAATGSDLAEGFAVVRHSRALMCVLVVWSIVMLASGIVNVAEVFLAKQSFHAGDFGFGLLWAGSGIGLDRRRLDGRAADRARPRDGVRPLPRDLRGRDRLRRGRAERLGRDRRDGPGRLRERRRGRREHHARAARRARPRARPRLHRADERELRRARARVRRRRARSRTRTARAGPTAVASAHRLSSRRRWRCASRAASSSSSARPRRRARDGAARRRRPTLAAGVRAGETRALARAISLVEDGDPAARELVAAALSRHRPRARDRPHRPARRRQVDASSPRSSPTSARAGLTVGVISVDPSSPFTQGALLGDRIRLADHFLDPGVFIRSMGTRGHAGGLSPRRRCRRC